MPLGIETQTYRAIQAAASDLHRMADAQVRRQKVEEWRQLHIISRDWPSVAQLERKLYDELWPGTNR